MTDLGKFGFQSLLRRSGILEKKKKNSKTPNLRVLSGNMWNVYFLGITPISWFRLSDEALGFLLPLAASGKKIQVHSIVLDFDRAEMRSLSKICPRCFVPPWTWLTKLVSPQLTVYRHLSDLCVLCHPMQLHPMPPQCLSAFIFHKSHLKMQIMGEVNCKLCKVPDVQKVKKQW